MGRPAELNEVITNLDPERHRRDAAGRRRCASARRAQDDRNVVFTVTDTGIGMTDEVRQRIFDPFFTTKGEEGTGLGLPVSYSIVKRHGGEMRVESRPGGGTTFTVVLPIGTAATPDVPVEADATARRTGRILLVDNDPQVMTILGEMLGDAGHHVRAGGQRAEAAARLRPRRLRPRHHQYRDGGHERAGTWPSGCASATPRCR